MKRVRSKTSGRDLKSRKTKKQPPNVTLRQPSLLLGGELLHSSLGDQESFPLSLSERPHNPSQLRARKWLSQRDTPESRLIREEGLKDALKPSLGTQYTLYKKDTQERLISGLLNSLRRGREDPVIFERNKEIYRIAKALERRPLKSSAQLASRYKLRISDIRSILADLDRRIIRAHGGQNKT